MSELSSNTQSGSSGPDGAKSRFSFRPRRPYTFDRVVRMIIGLTLAGAAIWLIERLSSVLLPFLVAWLIAYLLEPLVQQNRRALHLKGRFIAIVITLIEVTTVITALCIIFLPSIMREAHQMAAIISNYAEAKANIPFIPDSFHNFLRKTIDFKSLSENLSQQNLENIAKWLSGALANGIDFLAGIFCWLVVFLYVVFIMIDYDRLVAGFRKMVPPRYRKIVYGIANDVTYNMNHYFRGQALVSLCVGILFSIGFYIIGLPLGVVLGLFIGVLNMVPYLQLISLVPTTLLCLVCAVNGNVDFWTIWLECIAVYCICQVIQDMILTPKIMGKFMGLNPAVILLSLSVWGSLLGLIGLIIALPLTTLLLSYYNRYIIRDNDGGEGDLPSGKDREESSVGLTDIVGSKE